MPDFIDKYVLPFYIKFLHGNCVTRLLEDEEGFVRLTKNALQNISDSDLENMFVTGGWRAALSASWFCGLGKFTQHQNKIGELLIASPHCYAGQGHCLAMARFENEKSVEWLVKYLQKYVPVKNRDYDQLWAIGALKYLDSTLNRSAATIFLKDPKAWKLKTGKFIGYQLDTDEAINNFQNIIDWVHRRFDSISTG